VFVTVPADHGPSLAAYPRQGLVWHPAEGRAAKRSGRFGSGRLCDGCDLVLGSKDVEYNVKLPDGRTLSFPVTSPTTPEIVRAWRALAMRRVHSIAHVGLTPAQIEALGL
jgi:hypothetical protein